MSLRALLFVPLFCSVALADVPPASFARWVRSYAKQNEGVALHSWWSAHLDDDGKPELIAIVCRPAAPPDEYFNAAVLLLEEGSGTRHTVSLGALEYTAHDSCREPAPKIPFRRTNDKTVTYDPLIKRATAEVVMGLRDGRLVVLETTSAGGRYCESSSYSTFDFVHLRQEQEQLTDDDFEPLPNGDCKERRSRKREQAILLVTQPEVEAPAFTQLVGGKPGAHHGDADASVAVAITQPKRGVLQLRIRVTDDVARAASAQTKEALAIADHLQVWIGRHAVQLARDESGAWFALGEVTTVKSDGGALILDVPSGWAGWKRDGDVLRGSIVIAFHDVDDEGEPTVIATAPLPKRARPTGLVMRLPKLARWLPVGEEVPDPFDSE